MTMSPHRFTFITDAWIFTGIALLLCGNVFRADESWSKFSGPNHVYRGFRISPDFLVTSFISRSLIVCVCACLQSDSACVSVNYQQGSGKCDLLTGWSWGVVGEEPGWIAVILTQQLQINSLTTISAATTPACPTGFLLNENGCYFVDVQLYSVPEAVVACSLKSAELLSIETLEEQQTIGDLLTNYNDDLQLWTSGQGTGVDRYQWSSNGFAITYDNFTSGFPGGYYGEDSCIYIDRALGWKTDNCEHGLHGVICEYPKL